VFRHTQTKRKLSNNNSEYKIQSIIQQYKPPLYLGQLGKVGFYVNTENVYGILAEMLLGIRRFGRRRTRESYTNTDVMKLAWIKLAHPQPDFHFRVLCCSDVRSAVALPTGVLLAVRLVKDTASS
jgi:hypothetical protein